MKQIQGDLRKDDKRRLINKLMDLEFINKNEKYIYGNVIPEIGRKYKNLKKSFRRIEKLQILFSS